jgi:hypothetical protein
LRESFERFLSNWREMLSSGPREYDRGLSPAPVCCIAIGIALGE